MKKISIFCFAIVALSFASCKKDITCTCTITFTPTTGTADVSTYEYTVKKVTKSQAKDGVCRGLSNQQTAPVAGTKYDEKCELK